MTEVTESDVDRLADISNLDAEVSAIQTTLAATRRKLVRLQAAAIRDRLPQLDRSLILEWLRSWMDYAKRAGGERILRLDFLLGGKPGEENTEQASLHAWQTLRIIAEQLGALQIRPGCWRVSLGEECPLWLEWVTITQSG
jgi:hypothetical protein